MFTDEQKKFINEVILPNLVNMAVYDNIPSDMNELNYNHFEDAERARRWFKALSEDDQDGVREIMCYTDGEEGSWSDVYTNYWQEIEEFEKTIK